MSRVFAVSDDIFDECFEFCVLGSCKIPECIEFWLGRSIFFANVSNFLGLGSLKNANVSNFGSLGRFFLRMSRALVTSDVRRTRMYRIFA